MLPSTLETSALLTLASKQLNPVTVSEALGISPHICHRKGDRYEGRDRSGNIIVRERINGLWGLVSTAIVRSSDPAVHTSAIVDMVYPARDRFVTLCDHLTIMPHIWIHHARLEGEQGYSLDPSLLKRLSDLSVILSVTCDIVPVHDE